MAQASAIADYAIRDAKTVVVDIDAIPEVLFETRSCVEILTGLHGNPIRHHPMSLDPENPIPSRRWKLYALTASELNQNQSVDTVDHEKL
ncbi:MAG: hypothetical protein JO314_01830 [Acidobacteria bacterium]|nr:hypothetical protein [Acidobacteriota bacterium]